MGVKGVHGHGVFSSRDSNTMMNSSSSRRPLMKCNYYNMMMNNNAYVVIGILMLVFGAGILGVMGIHRLRERRVFEITIKDKDQQLLSLNVLLQKQKEQVHEYKKKTEELKAKIYSLRNQMTELNGRVMEMQATISSLKDEQRIIEKALEEKLNEAVSLRDRYNELKDHNPQVEALTETLRQRESELEELKRSLQTPPAKSLTSNVSNNETDLSGNGVTKNVPTHVQTEDLHDSASSSSLGNNKHDAEPHHAKTVETETSEGNLTRQDDQTKTLRESQGTENQNTGDIEGGAKLEIHENVVHSKSYRRRGKRSYLKRAKAKITKHTEPEEDNVSNLGKDAGVGQEKLRDQMRMQDSDTGLGFRDNLVPENQQVVRNEKIPDDVQGEAEAPFKSYIDSDSVQNNEESPPQSMLTDHKKPVETGFMNDEYSSVKSRTSLHEEPIYDVERRSSNEGSVQQIEEDESKEQEIAVGENKEKRENNGKLVGQMEVTESSSDRNSVQEEEIEETGSGANTSMEYEQGSEEENEAAKGQHNSHSFRFSNSLNVNDMV